MLSGDFATLPLSDLLQWLDVSRRDGVLEIGAVEASGLWIKIQNRTVVAVGPPPKPMTLQPLAHWLPPQAPETLWPEACQDAVLDLFAYSADSHFTFTDDASGFDDGVPLDLALAQLVLE